MTHTHLTHKAAFFSLALIVTLGILAGLNSLAAPDKEMASQLVAAAHAVKA